MGAGQFDERWLELRDLDVHDLGGRVEHKSLHQLEVRGEQVEVAMDLSLSRSELQRH